MSFSMERGIQTGIQPLAVQLVHDAEPAATDDGDHGIDPFRLEFLE